MRFTRDAELSLSGHTFPSTTSELIETHGDVELELPNGVVTLREVLEYLPEATLESEEDALLTLYGAFDEDAIGRKRYSDRDPPCVGEREYEPVSL